MDREAVEIFSDGACRGNPGAGGWGVLLRARGAERELYGGEPDPTNNRMELTAVIRALEALKRPSRVQVYTDSLYVTKGISEWVHDWKRRGWRTADKKPVKNVDLWQRLDEPAALHDVEWHWVRGHSASCRAASSRSEEHTSELQSRLHLVCRLLLEKKKK